MKNLWKWIDALVDARQAVVLESEYGSSTEGYSQKLLGEKRARKRLVRYIKRYCGVLPAPPKRLRNAPGTSELFPTTIGKRRP